MIVAVVWKMETIHQMFLSNRQTRSKVKLFNTSPASKAPRINNEPDKSGKQKLLKKKIPPDFHNKGRGDFSKTTFHIYQVKTQQLCANFHFLTEPYLGETGKEENWKQGQPLKTWYIVENQTRLRQELCKNSGGPATVIYWDRNQSGSGDHQME